MWVCAFTEEGDTEQNSAYHIARYPTRREAANAALTTLATALVKIQVALTIGAEPACIVMALKMKEDGDRLYGSDQGNWSGEAQSCDDHKPHWRRITYWMREMSDEQADDEEKLFQTAFPGGQIDAPSRIVPVMPETQSA